MLFLYGDDGSHFEHNKIPHKMTCGLVSVEGWPLIQVKITKKGLLPCDRGGRRLRTLARKFSIIDFFLEHFTIER